MLIDHFKSELFFKTGVTRITIQFFFNVQIPIHVNQAYRLGETADSKSNKRNGEYPKVTEEMVNAQSVTVTLLRITQGKT